MESFPAPSPELVLVLFGEPPLMLTPTGLAPARGVLALGSGGAPGFLPSGDMDTRAARFPGGGATGAGGPGVAESATSAGPEPLGELSAAATSGAGSAAPSCLRSAARGA